MSILLECLIKAEEIEDYDKEYLLDRLEIWLDAEIITNEQYDELLEEIEEI